MKQNTKKLLIALAIPLAVGGISTLLSGGMGDYRALNQPPLSPPGWVFPIVWTVLYLLMGYASYRVYTGERSTGLSGSALMLYGAQLFVNFLWPIVFFAFRGYLAAFFVLILLWVLILMTLRAFTAIDETAGDLLIPYLLWVTFAGYLNLGVYFLN
jgi:tryptophan-rich sensory protein